MYGRQRETSVIDRLLDEVHRGNSGALVIRGEPGIGKTALLDHAAGQAGSLHVMRRTGVPSETDLAFAGLHLLLRPVLHQTAKLPPPQRRALEAALGLSDTQGADPLLVGLGVLSLLAEVAEDGPVLCLIDDAHWLDRSSLQALLFAARRLEAEQLALVVTTRGEHLPGLPELRLSGLDSAAAAALLREADLTPAQRYRVLAEAQGNPLALIELPAVMKKGLYRPGGLPLSHSLRAVFHSQVDPCPRPRRRSW